MALIRATREKRTQVARRLLMQSECSVCAVAYNGYTALFWAVYHNYTEDVRLLLQKDTSNIDAQPLEGLRSTALMQACLRGNAIIIELLVQNGANLDIPDKFNRTAFQLLLLDQHGGLLSPEVETRLKDLPRIVKQTTKSPQQQRRSNNGNQLQIPPPPPQQQQQQQQQQQ
jgi:ankyrin repeat protein